MTLFDKIQSFLNGLDEKGWYRFVAAVVGGLLLIIILILFLYYRSVNTWIDTINDINESRTQAQEILTKAQRVQKQRAEVNSILQEDPNFKIAGYLQEVTDKVGIGQARTNITTTQIDREDTYREDIATVPFVGTTMKQLSELLDILEQNKRLYIKELEITKSKKTPKSIDATLVIATMQPRQPSLA